MNIKGLLGAALLGLLAGTATAEDLRRVVVSEAADGGSFIASDAAVAAADMAGVGALFTLWGNDGVGRFPDDGAMPAFTELYPPVGGFRVYVTVFPAGQEVTPAAESLSGGAAKLSTTDIPGLHKSDTTDFDMVLKGTIDCILSDGTVITLKAGESIVLNGADHAWRNSGTEDAHVLFFMAGAERG